MLTKEEIIDEAKRLKFADIGFTGAEPFGSQKDYLLTHQEEYGWAEAIGLGLLAGTDPRNILAGAKSIIVVLESYFEESFPQPMERHFGRCYLDDDRITQDGLALKIKAFRKYLKANGVNSKVPFHLPHRLSAARAGLGTFGNNCIFYARRVARGSSFVFPIALVVDCEFTPDEPSVAMGCPDWCRNACVAACPTRALKGGGKIDPRRCISSHGPWNPLQPFLHHPIASYIAITLHTMGFIPSQRPRFHAQHASEYRTYACPVPVPPERDGPLAQALTQTARQNLCDFLSAKPLNRGFLLRISLQRTMYIISFSRKISTRRRRHGASPAASSYKLQVKENQSECITNPSAGRPFDCNDSRGGLLQIQSR